MVNLQVTFFIVRIANSALTPIVNNKLLFEDFGKRFTSPNPPCLYVTQTTETISGYTAPITTFRSKGFYRNTLFPYITNGTRRMFVAIKRFEFFGCDKPMLDNMVNDDSRTFTLNKG